MQGLYIYIYIFPPGTQRANIYFHEEWPLRCTRRMKEQGKNRGTSLWKEMHNVCIDSQGWCWTEPERVLVSTGCRAPQKRCAALQTEMRCQWGSEAAQGLPGYFSVSLFFFGKVHFFEIRTVWRKGSGLINPFLLFSVLFLFLFK